MKKLALIFTSAVLAGSMSFAEVSDSGPDTFTESMKTTKPLFETNAELQAWVAAKAAQIGSGVVAIATEAGTWVCEVANGVVQAVKLEPNGAPGFTELDKEHASDK